MPRRRSLFFAITLGALLLPAQTQPVSAAVPRTPCGVFPTDNVWNADISSLPVHSRSAAWLTSMGGASRRLHPDFGPSGDPSTPYGIPYIVTDSTHPTTNLTFTYSGESDQVTYPFGPDTPIEGGSSSAGDRHALMLNRDTCRLYELYDAHYSASGSTAGSGATWSLQSDALRPDTWTSGDAAGLPIFPGLLRRDEVAAGFVGHAIRVTAQRTDTSHLWPARHDAGSASDPSLPPMGARFRMRGNVDISHFSAPAQVVLRTFQHYGLIVADNGSNWYFTGAADNGWDTSLLDELKAVPAGDFEAVDESSLMADPNSGAVRPSSTMPVGGVTLDAYGGVHPVGTLSVDTSGAPYWPGWRIARGVALLPGGTGGYTLDGWGGIHAFGHAPPGTGGPYWRGWDIARGVALRPQGGGYVLDGWGGIHPFGGAPTVTLSAYWPGWDIARALAVAPDGTTGQVLDGWGGLHPFAMAGTSISATPSASAYWRGWDIARGIALLPGRAADGYVLDGWGGVHPFGSAPAATVTGYRPGADAARGIALTSVGPPQGYIIDADGILATLGSAAPLATTPPWGYDVLVGMSFG